MSSTSMILSTASRTTVMLAIGLRSTPATESAFAEGESLSFFDYCPDPCGPAGRHIVVQNVGQFLYHRYSSYRTNRRNCRRTLTPHTCRLGPRDTTLPSAVQLRQHTFANLLQSHATPDLVLPSRRRRDL